MYGVKISYFWLFCLRLMVYGHCRTGTSFMYFFLLVYCTIIFMADADAPILHLQPDARIASLYHRKLTAKVNPNSKRTVYELYRYGS